MSLVNGLTALGFRVIRFDNRDVGLSTHLSEKGPPDIGAAMMAAMSGQPYAGAAYLLDDMAADAVGLLDALSTLQDAELERYMDLEEIEIEAS